MEKGTCIEYRFPAPVRVSGARIIWDSDLNRTDQPEVQGTRFSHNMMCNKPLNFGDFHVPGSMVRAYRLEAITAAGERLLLAEDDQSHCRRLCVPVNAEISALRLTCLDTWGAEKCRVFSFDFR